jgi:hypothetical protein
MLPGATRTASAQNNLIWSASAAFGLNQDRGHNGGSVRGRGKTQVALRDRLPVGLCPRPTEFTATY